MNNLKKLREKKGMTQTAIAKQLGISRQSYNHYELGNREPDFEMLTKISIYFNTSIDEILGIEPKFDITEPKPLPAHIALDEQLDGIEFALYGEVRDLTDGEKQDILDYVRFKKAQKEAAKGENL